MFMLVGVFFDGWLSRLILAINCLLQVEQVPDCQFSFSQMVFGVGSSC